MARVLAVGLMASGRSTPGQARFDERDPLYLEVATQVLDLAVLSPQQVGAVLAALTD